MLYLITGANGAGKTLNTLKWIRERSVKEGRPVCHNGRFEPVPGGELESWKPIDMKDWQSEPDGTIFLVDECHNDFPLRPPSGTPPEYVRMLAEHRRRGFDFYLVTQHPQNIDAFVRRLIGSPGWHRHLKRSFGGDLVSVLEWSAVNPNCEKPGSGKTGTATMQAFPKEVFTWYKSASLHTGKRKIPKQVWFLLVALFLIPLLLYYAGKSLYDKTQPADKPAAVATSLVGGPGGVASVQQVKHLSTNDYLEERRSRIPDFPHTAPAYDKVTQPVEAPYPAACVQMGSRCDCYTQQATYIRVSAENCAQIVKFGFFMDWAKPERKNHEPRITEKPAPVQASASARPVQHVRSVPIPDFPEPDSSNIVLTQVASAVGVKKPSFLGGVK
jgi:zona occludens toxin